MRAIIEYLFPAVRMRREEAEAEIDALSEKWRVHSMVYYDKLAMIQSEIARRAKLHEQRKRKLTTLRRAARRPKPSRRVISA